ncbi:hypothetical protein SJ05684_c36220 [Sinorhizobium sojae CCBAU 05684]|uniref:Uncharacterized protein n=1 Tax=Sinorhizobium sojae CCBAU 05684 TaxID=716928 RepID=A0A249PGY4_9HYPH|nr:hypothetical protein SJ05684_c36220 [Sinorhizobium sojae CCBAU 05684]
MRRVDRTRPEPEPGEGGKSRSLLLRLARTHPLRADFLLKQIRQRFDRW